MESPGQFSAEINMLAGLFPDVQIGEAPGSALLFNMERLFETVLGQRIRSECKPIGGRRLSVELQGPLTNLATTGFQLRPDVSVMDDNLAVAIVDAKWKRLETGKPNSGVASADAYQMNAYASRYRCNRLSLVYPASFDRPPGRVTEFVLMTEERPVLKVVTVDVRELAFGSGLPGGFEEIIPWTRARKPAPMPPSVFAVA